MTSTTSTNEYDIKIDNYYFKIVNKNIKKDPERLIINIQSSTNEKFNVENNNNYFSVYLSIDDIGLACYKLYNNDENNSTQSSFIHIELQKCIDGKIKSLIESDECYSLTYAKNINEHVTNTERQIDELPFKNYNINSYNLNIFSHELESLYEYNNLSQQLFTLFIDNKKNNFYVYFYKVELNLKENKDNLDNIVLYFCSTHIEKFKDVTVEYYKKIYLPVLLTTKECEKITQFGTFKKYILAGNYICKVLDTEINKRNKYQIIFPLSQIEIYQNYLKNQQKSHDLSSMQTIQLKNLLDYNYSGVDSSAKKILKYKQENDKRNLKKKIEKDKNFTDLELIQHKELTVLQFTEQVSQNQKLLTKKHSEEKDKLIQRYKAQEQINKTVKVNVEVSEIDKENNIILKIDQERDKEQQIFEHDLEARRNKLNEIIKKQYEIHLQKQKTTVPASASASAASASASAASASAASASAALAESESLIASLIASASPLPIASAPITSPMALASPVIRSSASPLPIASVPASKIPSLISSALPVSASHKASITHVPASASSEIKLPLTNKIHKLKILIDNHFIKINNLIK